MRKYIGTSTTSKNRKKRNRSRARNVPRQPASSTSIQPRNALTSRLGDAPSIASGNSTPVSTTRNSEIPSTPSFHWMPKALIHWCCDTNWKPGLCSWNFTISQTVSAAVATAPTVATALSVSSRARGISRTMAPAMAGTRMMAVRSGKPVVTSAPRHPEHDPQQQHGAAGRDRQGVIAHVAGLQPAQLAAAVAHQGGHAVHGAVDDLFVDDEGGERGQGAAGGLDDGGVQGVDAPGVPQDHRLELGAVHPPPRVDREGDASQCR